MKLNKTKGWIGLKGLRIKSSIGVYYKEKQNGSMLELDVWVYGDLAPAIESDQLDKSINYEILAQIADEEIKSGNHLIEPIAGKILERVLNEIPLVERAKLELRKMHPPLMNPCEASVVRLKLKKKKLKV